MAHRLDFYFEIKESSYFEGAWLYKPEEDMFHFPWRSFAQTAASHGASKSDKQRVFPLTALHPRYIDRVCGQHKHGKSVLFYFLRG